MVRCLIADPPSINRDMMMKKTLFAPYYDATVDAYGMTHFFLTVNQILNIAKPQSVKALMAFTWLF